MKIDATRFLKFAITPHGVLICSIILSFLAWVFPGFGFLRKGFEKRDSLVAFGALILYLLYGSMIIFAFLSYRIGAKSSPRKKELAARLSLHHGTPYTMLSLVALAGCGYFFFYLINSVGLSGIIGFIGQGQANEIKKALYEDYSVGPLSLRYIVILTGGIALFRIVAGISRSLLDFCNILFLLLTGLASSRLSVITSCILGTGLIIAYARTIRLPLWKPIVAAAAIFSLLAIYNSTRNANFYAERGNEGFLNAGLSEMITYLGTPFQGSLSTAGHLEEIASGASAQDFAGIEPTLTTNSALMQLTTSAGLWGGPILVGTTFLAAFFIGAMSPYRATYLGLPYFVLLYGLSEIWRVYIFNQGIFLVLLVFSFVPVFIALILKPRFSSTTNRSNSEGKSNEESG